MQRTSLRCRSGAKVIKSVEARIEHLRNWGNEQGMWRTEAEREVVLKPLEDLERALIRA